MKVEVLQAKDAKFGKFSWWSDWVDVAVYNWVSDHGYLLQMKVSRTNAKKFKSVNITGLLGKNASVQCIGNLTDINKETNSK